MTMKKNLFLRLCLMMIAWLSLNSCRQDILPEQETYHNTSAFQLTSKRISLNESKHKGKLVSEIKQAEDKLKTFSDTNALGKIVNYGIDTESVIYIENGSNYHTYTFNITRENNPADAPLENLLLTPLPDGTYKKLLVSYNFTEQEKQIIKNGGYVNTKGKSKVTDLGKGTLDDIVSKSQSCGYVEAQAYTICSEGVHYHGESNCNADVKSQLITVYLWKCESIDDGSGTSGGGPSSGSGPGDGGGGSPCPDCPTDGGTTPTEPCNGNGVLTGPLDPTTDIGDGSTCTGVPTLPNIPNLADDPCVKTKRSITAANTLLKNTDMQTKMDAVLKGKISAPNEWAIAVGTDNGAYDVTLPNEGGPHSSVAPVSWLHNASTFFADGHAHSGGPANPSAGDFYGMLEQIVKPNSNFMYSFIYGKSNNVDEVYALVLNDKAAAQAFLDTYPRAQNYDPVTHDFLRNSDLWREIDKMKTIYNNKSTTTDTSGETYNPPSVGLAYMLEKLNSGISIAKVDANGNLKKINASTEKIGNDERAKVSKCP